MTVRYVGPGGSDSNNGLSWANRKLTLNGVEDTPVVAGDTVYVGPGVYREELVTDVDGSSGNPITYIGDVTGENTDGVGGLVRITRANEGELTKGSGNCIAIDHEYRTFRGFYLDTSSDWSYLIDISGFGGDAIIEDCVLNASWKGNGAEITTNALTGPVTFRRCVITAHDTCISFEFTGINALVENCLFLGSSPSSDGVIFTNSSATGTVKNCTFIGCGTAVDSVASITVNNCILDLCGVGFSGANITEDYNCISNSVVTKHSGTTPGSNTVNQIPFFAMPILYAGIAYPWRPGDLSEWSGLVAKAGSGEASDDLYGLTRPSASAQKSWGAVQYSPASRQTGNPAPDGAPQLRMADYGEHLVFQPVIPGESITITVKVYRAANYAGTLPQMIIREPGQSDRITTDTGSSEQYNTLSDTFTPSFRYVVVSLKSNNTASSGDYYVDFADLQATV